MKWKKRKVVVDNKNLEVTFPVIISASRSTDIPAFHSQWFVNRLKKGYCEKINPFNGKSEILSFENCRLIVFWSKKPSPIVPYLDFLYSKNINFYFLYTLNDYEKEKLEPGLESLEKRIDTFKKLSSLIGKEKVIWRFDPIILLKDSDIDEVFMKVKTLGDRLYGYTDRLVFSFFKPDQYITVKRNLLKHDVHCKSFTRDMILEFSQKLSSYNKENWNYELGTCAENVDLSDFNIKKNKCIDDDLIVKLFSNDHSLMEFIKGEEYQADLFNLNKEQINYKNIKDKNQRKECGCIASKDIGAYSTCPHFCLYCYANKSEVFVLNNFKNCNIRNMSLLK